VSAHKTAVTPAMIQAFLAQHPGSTLRDVVAGVHCHFNTAARLLEEMRQRGQLTATPNKGYKDSFLYWPARLAIAEPRAALPFRPLGRYDLGALMRMCQGARNSKTGVV
tara:strand:- start:37947 stop:38273 length:327 start_codon:yes stop_codon:yes gene_type:complete